MKLQNKTTTNIKVLGEIVSCNEHGCIAVKTDEGVVWYYRSLAELNEEWEDYEEPKKYWYISDCGDVYGFSDYYVGSEIEEAHREIGNLFETKEEAEKAVEKLKAWKRLKDAGFWFKSDSIKNGHKYEYILRLQCEEDKRFKTFKENEALFNDLKLLFRGEV